MEVIENSQAVSLITELASIPEETLQDNSATSKQVNTILAKYFKDTSRMRLSFARAVADLTKQNDLWNVIILMAPPKLVRYCRDLVTTDPHLKGNGGSTEEPVKPARTPRKKQEAPPPTPTPEVPAEAPAPQPEATTPVEPPPAPAEPAPKPARTPRRKAKAFAQPAEPAVAEPAVKIEGSWTGDGPVESSITPIPSGGTEEPVQVLATTPIGESVPVAIVTPSPEVFVTRPQDDVEIRRLFAEAGGRFVEMEANIKQVEVNLGQYINKRMDELMAKHQEMIDRINRLWVYQYTALLDPDRDLPETLDDPIPPKK